MPPIFILVGPSGAGKSTVQERLLTLPELNLTRALTTTTRAPRPGERNGVDFWFLTPEQFQAGVDRGEFLEHVETFGRRYGTTRAELERKQAEGKAVLMVTDMAGALAIRSELPDTHIFFIDAPRNQLIARLKHRYAEAPDLDGRIKRFEEEKASKIDADVVVENPDGQLDETVSEMASLIRTRYHHP